MSTSVLFAYLFGIFDHDMTNAIGKGNLVAMHNAFDRIRSVDRVMFEAVEWWTHQDLYVLQKS